MSEEEGFDSIASDVPTVCAQAVVLGNNIIEIIEGTQEGFDEQSKMLRKMGLKLFKKNAKMPIEEWLQYAKDLVPELEKMEKSMEKGDKEEITRVMVPISEAKLKLMDLKDNYIKTAKMAERFLKGDDLKDALDGLNLSERRISLLIEAIEFLEKN
jgi:hypothetical protein